MGLDPQPAREFTIKDFDGNESNLQFVHWKSDPKAVFVLHPEHPSLALVVADDEAPLKEERLLHLNARLSRHLGQET